MTLLDLPHLLGITVIVRQRLVDSSEIDIEPLGDSDRGVTSFFDPLSGISDVDSTPGRRGSLCVSDSDADTIRYCWIAVSFHRQ